MNGLCRQPNIQEGRPAGQGQGPGWGNLDLYTGDGISGDTRSQAPRSLWHRQVQPTQPGESMCPPPPPGWKPGPGWGRGASTPRSSQPWAARGTRVGGCWSKGPVLEPSREEDDSTEVLGNEASPGERPAVRTQAWRAPSTVENCVPYGGQCLARRGPGRDGGPDHGTLVPRLQCPDRAGLVSGSSPLTLHCHWAQSLSCSSAIWGSHDSGRRRQPAAGGQSGSARAVGTS